MISVKNVLIKLKQLKMCFLKRECEQNIQERIRSRAPDDLLFQGRLLEKRWGECPCASEAEGLWQRPSKLPVRRFRMVGFWLRSPRVESLGI